MMREPPARVLITIGLLSLPSRRPFSGHGQGKSSKDRLKVGQQPATGSTAKKDQVNYSKGRALLVGIDQYEQPDVRRTPGAEEDARQIKEFIKGKYGFLDAEIKLLLGNQAT